MIEVGIIFSFKDEKRKLIMFKDVTWYCKLVLAYKLKKEYERYESFNLFIYNLSNFNSRLINEDYFRLLEHANEVIFGLENETTYWDYETGLEISIHENENYSVSIFLITESKKISVLLSENIEKFNNKKELIKHLSKFKTAEDYFKFLIKSNPELVEKMKELLIMEKEGVYNFILPERIRRCIKCLQ